MSLSPRILNKDHVHTAMKASKALVPSYGTVGLEYIRYHNVDLKGVEITSLFLRGALGLE